MKQKHRPGISEGCAEAATGEYICESQYSAGDGRRDEHDSGVMRSKQASDASQQFHVAGSHGPHQIKNEDDDARKKTTDNCAYDPSPSEEARAQQNSNRDYRVSEQVRDAVLLYVNNGSAHGHDQCIETKQQFRIHGIHPKVTKPEPARLPPD